MRAANWAAWMAMMEDPGIFFKPWTVNMVWNLADVTHMVGK